MKIEYPVREERGRLEFKGKMWMGREERRLAEEIQKGQITLRVI